LWIVQFSVALCGRGSVHWPFNAPVSVSKKNSDFMLSVCTGYVVSFSTAPVVWQRACTPPLGSWPKISVEPSFENAAEWPVLMFLPSSTFMFLV
jgi:hypothetical protein